jgi:uncharacterized repeat protein (TIGR03803 family)
MFGKLQLLTACVLTLLLSSPLIILARPAQAQTEKVLYSFSGPPGDGSGPYAGLVFDKESNLYGTTSAGGEHYDGTVFEITADGTEKVLYNFGSQSGDGCYPEAGLVFDKKGNLYGTTYDCGEYGEGTVFEITAAGTEKVLYSFGSQSGDGYRPWAGLVFDKKGNLYGTTFNGGNFDYGTVFEITKAGREKVLYSFSGPPGDGSLPLAGLVFDKGGNLYGTTTAGGEYGGPFVGGGTVFEVTADGTEKVLYSFCSQPNCTDGTSPYAGLVFDKKGNLYGTTFEGGVSSYGTVFEITSDGMEKVLYSFCPQGYPCSDGYNPYAGLIFDKKRNLYGTTYQGGTQGWGTVFEITKAGTEKVLYNFNPGNGSDGYNPYAGLIFDDEGNLYGTTIAGGLSSGGTVFEVTLGGQKLDLQK